MAEHSGYVVSVRFPRPGLSICSPHPGPCESQRPGMVPGSDWLGWFWHLGLLEEPGWSRTEQSLTVLTHPSRTRNTNAAPVPAPQAKLLNEGDFSDTAEHKVCPVNRKPSLPSSPCPVPSDQPQAPPPLYLGERHWL